MSPDPAELAPSRDPAAYGRRPLFTGVFFAWISLCLVCVLAGAAIARFALPPEFGRKAEPARVETPKAAPATEAPVTPTAATPPAATPADPGLADRVARLEGAQGRTDHAAASALAAASLSDAAATSRPFADELASLAPLFPDSADLRALRPLAIQGAPTHAALAAALPDAAAQAAQAVGQPDKDAGFLAKVWAAITKVVILRRVDDTAPGAEGVLARAQSRAATGDLEGALGLIDTLPATAREALSDWSTPAHRRADIDHHIARLRAQALADLTPPPQSRPGAAR